MNRNSAGTSTSQPLPDRAADQPSSSTKPSRSSHTTAPPTHAAMATPSRSPADASRPLTSRRGLRSLLVSVMTHPGYADRGGALCPDLLRFTTAVGQRLRLRVLPDDLVLGVALDRLEARVPD